MITKHWLVTNPPPPPTIYATIITDSWQMTAADSGGANGSFNVISVLQHSLLLLACQAAYPVFWHGQDGKKVRQNRTNNSVLEERNQHDFNANYSDLNQYQVPAIEQYEAVMTFSNITKGTVAACSCVEYGPMSPEFLQTTIHVDVHKAPRVYSVDKPDQDIQYPNTKDTNKTFMEDDIMFKTLSWPGFSHLSVIFNCGWHCIPEEYVLVIRGQLANGTWITRNYEIYLKPDIIQNSIMELEPLMPPDVYTYLPSDILYLARMYLPAQPVLAKTYLFLQERMPNGTKCNVKFRLASQAREACGIVGFSLFNENTNSQGIQISLRAKKSCVIHVFTAYENERSNQTVVEVMRFTIFITVLDDSVFFWSRLGYIAPVAPALRTDSVAYSNETIQLQCTLPKCNFDLVFWSKDGQILDLPPYDPDVLYGSSSLNSKRLFFRDNGPNTEVYVLKMESLNISDSGIYMCGVISYSTGRKYPNSDVIKLEVRDPIKPHFDDGKQFYTEKKTLPRGDTLSLHCNVTGDPEPRISWFLRILQDNGTYWLSEVRHNENTMLIIKPGVYICNAENKYGVANKTFEVNFVEQTSYVPIAVAIPSAIVGLALIALLFWWLRRRAVDASFKELSQLLKNPPEPVQIDDSVPLNDQVQFIPYNHKQEISRDVFTVTSKLLGEGEFGYIFKGELKLVGSNSTCSVAVKTPRDPWNLQHFRALVDEMKIMCQIRPHVNVLALGGACTENVDKKQLFVLTEFCDNGSVRDYLIQNRMKFEGFEVNATGLFLGASGAVEALLKYAYQAVNGMEHLASERIIHRDLALRNLLLTANHIVKISDFGLSKKHNLLYKKRLSPDVPVPVFWMSPESLLDSQYTQKSDVWSFGIVLWEMFSCGRTPYPDRYPDLTFLTWLRAKETNRMGPPSIVSEDMYKLMLSCWKGDPDACPTFSECKRMIAGTLEQISPLAYQSILLSLSEAWLRLSPNDIASTASGIEGPRPTQGSASHEEGDESWGPDAPTVQPSAVDASTENPIFGLVITSENEDDREKGYDNLNQKMTSGNLPYVAPF